MDNKENLKEYIRDLLKGRHPNIKDFFNGAEPPPKLPTKLDIVLSKTNKFEAATDEELNDILQQYNEGEFEWTKIKLGWR